MHRTLSYSFLAEERSAPPLTPGPISRHEQRRPERIRMASSDFTTLTRCAFRSVASYWPLARSPAHPALSHTLNDGASLGAAARGDLTILLTAIQTTCKAIAFNVRRATLLNL